MLLNNSQQRAFLRSRVATRPLHTSTRCLSLVVRANAGPGSRLQTCLTSAAAASLAAAVLVSWCSQPIRQLQAHDGFHHTKLWLFWLSLQTFNPAAVSAYDTLTKPNTTHLGTESRNAAAELEAIISSRNGSTRALPTLTASPALLVRCVCHSNTRDLGSRQSSRQGKLLQC